MIAAPVLPVAALFTLVLATCIVSITGSYYSYKIGKRISGGVLGPWSFVTASVLLIAAVSITILALFFPVLNVAPYFFPLVLAVFILLFFGAVAFLIGMVLINRVLSTVLGR